MKHSVHFPSGDGLCAGDLYLPVPGERRSRGSEPVEGEGPAPPPVVIMAHGIGAERSFGLEPFARKFLERGLAVLVFDYRHFGTSSGEPRYLVSPPRQVQDYLAAVAFVAGDARVDGGRMAFWGTSFSGGHVLTAAARMPEGRGLRAVVSQIPFVSGLSSTFAYPMRYQLPAVGMAALDRLGALVGRAPLTVRVVREKGIALLASPDSFDGYMATIPEGTDWPGEVPARVFLSVLTYRPLSSAPGVKVPTLMVVASNDAICPAPAARRAARRVPDCRLVEFPIGHFDPYQGEWFEKVGTLEADFLAEKLRT